MKARWIIPGHVSNHGGGRRESKPSLMCTPMHAYFKVSPLAFSGAYSQLYVRRISEKDLLY